MPLKKIALCSKQVDKHGQLHIECGRASKLPTMSSCDGMCAGKAELWHWIWFRPRLSAHLLSIGFLERRWRVTLSGHAASSMLAKLDSSLPALTSACSCDLTARRLSASFAHVRLSSAAIHGRFTAPKGHPFGVLKKRALKRHRSAVKTAAIYTGGDASSAFFLDIPWSLTSSDALNVPYP